MRKILITGSSGFLGKYFIHQFLEHRIVTLGRNRANINCDLSVRLPNLVTKVDLVIHSAGKAHSVPETAEHKQLFFDVNVTGTKNLLTGLEQSPVLPKSFIFISSVAVYGLEQGGNINEASPLNAIDPYGLSKIQAENLVQEWCKKHNVICTILRLPLLAGTNPPGNLGAMINGIQRGYYFDIAGGKAKKSIVLAEDVARVIPKVAEIGGIYNLTDGYHPSFAELSESIAKQLGKSKPFNIPHWVANAMGRTGDVLGPQAPINSNKLRKITSDLTFDDSKARKLLGWNPTPVLEGFKIR